MTIEEFTRYLQARVETLLAVNDWKVRPWGRRDFIHYVQGAIETYFFFNGNPKHLDKEVITCNIVIDAGVLDKLPEEA